MHVLDSWAEGLCPKTACTLEDWSRDLCILGVLDGQVGLQAGMPTCEKTRLGNRHRFDQHCSEKGYGMW